MNTQDKSAEISFFDSVVKSDRSELTDVVLYEFEDCDFIIGSHILEAGCGTGDIGRYIAENHHAYVIGVDISPEMVRKANELNESEHFHSIIGDLEDRTLFSPDTFDVVICKMILHHFPDFSRTVTNLILWLKSGGKLIVIEPNGSNPIKRFSKFIRVIIRKTNEEMLLERQIATINEVDHPPHSYLEFMKNANLDIEEIGFHPDQSPIPKIRDTVSALVALKKVLYRIVWFILPNPYGGTSVRIHARKPLNTLQISKNQ